MELSLPEWLAMDAHLWYRLTSALVAWHEGIAEARKSAPEAEHPGGGPKRRR